MMAWAGQDGRRFFKTDTRKAAEHRSRFWSIFYTGRRFSGSRGVAVAGSAFRD